MKGNDNMLMYCPKCYSIFNFDKSKISDTSIPFCKKCDVKLLEDNRPALSESDFFDKVIGMALAFYYDDNVWKCFGFNKKPKRGRLFNIFVSNERLKKEKFIDRELVILFFYLSSFMYKANSELKDQLKCADRLVSRLLNYEGIASAFGFDSYKNAEKYFQQHINNYFNCGITSVWFTFSNHAKSENVELNILNATEVFTHAMVISSSFISEYKKKYRIVSDI